MVKEMFYAKARLSKKNRDMLNTINAIIEEYQAQGYKLTLRQLYYQLVSRDIIPNKLAEYQKLSTLLKDGRMMGIVDWNSIEDRVRIPKVPYCCTSIYDALYDTASMFRLDRQLNQDTYVEVWAEKDALSGILYSVTRDYHIKLVINRGYSSCTAMYDTSYRLLDAIKQGKKCVILYLGDHDPSGEDMVRDIIDRLEEFGLNKDMLTVKKIGLTYDQVLTFNPPPNPAKVKDPRAKGYIAKYGPVSWEVDALRPDILDSLLRSEVEKFISVEKFNERKESETSMKNILLDLAEEYKQAYGEVA